VLASISMLNGFILFQLQRRMNIAELKQISSRPDVVEVGIHFVVVSPIINFFSPHSYFLVRLLLAIMQILCNSIFFFHFKVWDATSADPKLLVFLKSYRNTVPVPRHWCQKRKFLQVRQHSKLIIMVLRCKHVWGLLVYLYVGCMNRVRKITSIWFLLYVCMWYLQGSICGNHQVWNCRCLALSSLESFIFYIFVIYVLYLC
jgi:hypothetical protein